MTDAYKETGGLPGRDTDKRRVRIEKVPALREHIDLLNKVHNANIVCSLTGTLVANTPEDMDLLHRDMIAHPELYE